MPLENRRSYYPPRRKTIEADLPGQPLFVIDLVDCLRDTVIDEVKEAFRVLLNSYRGFRYGALPGNSPRIR